MTVQQKLIAALFARGVGIAAIAAICGLHPTEIEAAIRMKMQELEEAK